MEAAMMNLGVILPEPGYLAAVREITRRHGIVLIFDEVKTGLCVAAGGATERFGVVPDMVTLAKALGGGLPSGAIGATDEIMEVVASDKVKQVGTYNGNPLSMAAARASLLEVLTPEAYVHLDRLNDRLIAGCDEILARSGIAGYTVGISSKGCVHFTDAPIRDYTSFMEHQNAELPELAWLYNANRGVLMAPGREEEWTLSVQHTDADVDRYLESLDAMAKDLAS
jgi:glutamate-1-semialdehyde 2,1-aminomutase